MTEQNTTTEATTEAAQATTEAATQTTEAKAAEPKTFDEAYVQKLRAEAAENRTKARDAETAADTKIKAALKALGIEDEAEDPIKAAEAKAAETAKERDTARATARDTAAELIVWRNAKELGVNPAALTDSKQFERAIKDLDPTDAKFGEVVKAAAKAAAENNPLLKAVQAAGASGADFSGGTGEKPTKPTTLHEAVANRYGVR